MLRTLCITPPDLGTLPLARHSTVPSITTLTRELSSLSLDQAVTRQARLIGQFDPFAGPGTPTSSAGKYCFSASWLLTVTASLTLPIFNRVWQF